MSAREGWWRPRRGRGGNGPGGAEAAQVGRPSGVGALGAGSGSNLKQRIRAEWAKHISVISRPAFVLKAHEKNAFVKKL